MKPAAALAKRWDKRQHEQESDKAQGISLKLGGVISSNIYFYLI